jgi:hypothetical protein
MNGNHELSNEGKGKLSKYKIANERWSTQNLVSRVNVNFSFRKEGL